jgi:hypothetical protein
VQRHQNLEVVTHNKVYLDINIGSVNMKHLKKVDVLFVVLILLALRSLIDANIAQAIIFLGFAGFVGFSRWMDNNQKQDLSEEVKKELESMRNIVSGLAVKSAAKSNDNKRFF